MSRFVALAALGAGGAATASVGGAYMLGVFGPGDGLFIPNTKEALEKWDGGECNYFRSDIPTLTPKTDSIALDSNFNANDSNFFSQEAEGGVRPKSCVSVNWDKKKYVVGSGHKWDGTLRFFWTVEQGTKGLMVYLLAEAKDGTLKFSGSSYALKKQARNGGQKWTVVQKADVGVDKTMTTNDINNKFPKTSVEWKGVNDKWNFMDETDDYSKIRTSSDSVKSPSSSHLRGRWEFESSASGSDSKALNQWTQNMSFWWDHCYSTSALNATPMTSSIKGKWIQKELKGDPEIKSVA